MITLFTAQAMYGHRSIISTVHYNISLYYICICINICYIVHMCSIKSCQRRVWLYNMPFLPMFASLDLLFDWLFLILDLDDAGFGIFLLSSTIRRQ